MVCFKTASRWTVTYYIVIMIQSAVMCSFIVGDSRTGKRQGILGFFEGIKNPLAHVDQFIQQTVQRPPPASTDAVVNQIQQLFNNVPISNNNDQGQEGAVELEEEPRKILTFISSTVQKEAQNFLENTLQLGYRPRPPPPEILTFPETPLWAQGSNKPIFSMGEDESARETPTTTSTAPPPPVSTTTIPPRLTTSVTFFDKFERVTSAAPGNTGSQQHGGFVHWTPVKHHGEPHPQFEDHSLSNKFQSKRCPFGAKSLNINCWKSAHHYAGVGQGSGHNTQHPCKGGLCPPRGIPSKPHLIPGSVLLPEKGVNDNLHFPFKRPSSTLIFPSSEVASDDGDTDEGDAFLTSSWKPVVANQVIQEDEAGSGEIKADQVFATVTALVNHSSPATENPSANAPGNPVHAGGPSAPVGDPGNVANASLGTNLLDSLLSSLSWHDRISVQRGTLNITIDNFNAREEELLIGIFKPNLPNQRCRTPRGDQGHCRFLHYCTLPMFAADFSVFRSYACKIQNSYVGVCCPDWIFQPVVDAKESPGSTKPPLVSQLPVSCPSGKDIQQRGCGVRVGKNDEVVRVEARNRAIERYPLNRMKTVICSILGRNSPGCKSSVVGLVDTSRIVGGIVAEPLDWPWMAALMRNNSDGFCGGALISDLHVLTAAHCVAPFQPAEIQVRLGEYDFGRLNDSDHDDLPVLRMVKHPLYNPRTYENDIAIVTLSRVTKFSCDVWPLCLPPSRAESSLEGAMATVTGWGTLAYGGPSSKVLREVSLPIWNPNDCDRAYPQKISNTTQLCAGHLGGQMDACQGDSGGPLMIKQGSRWMIAGIVSYGIRCAEPNYPGVYTRVDSYVDWINETMKPDLP